MLYTPIHPSTILLLNTTTGHSTHLKATPNYSWSLLSAPLPKGHLHPLVVSIMPLQTTPILSWSHSHHSRSHHARPKHSRQIHATAPNQLQTFKPTWFPSRPLHYSQLLTTPCHCCTPLQAASCHSMHFPATPRPLHNTPGHSMVFPSTSVTSIPLQATIHLCRQLHAPSYNSTTLQDTFTPLQVTHAQTMTLQTIPG